MTIDFSGKTILVTGASGGIGQAIAQAFAEANGITFPLLSDVHREAVEAYGVALGDFVIPGYTVAQRSVFVVEADGSIGYAWVADNPGLEPDYDAVMAHCESP